MLSQGIVKLPISRHSKELIPHQVPILVNAKLAILSGPSDQSIARTVTGELPFHTNICVEIHC